MLEGITSLLVTLLKNTLRYWKCREDIRPADIKCQVRQHLLLNNELKAFLIENGKVTEAVRGIIGVRVV